MYKHRQRLHRSEWEAEKQKTFPPNIMQQAKQGSKFIKVKSTDLPISTIVLSKKESLPTSADLQQSFNSAELSMCLPTTFNCNTSPCSSVMH